MVISSNKAEIFSGHHDWISMMMPWKYLSLVWWNHHFINIMAIHEQYQKMYRTSYAARTANFCYGYGDHRDYTYESYPCSMGCI